MNNHYIKNALTLWRSVETSTLVYLRGPSCDSMGWALDCYSGDPGSSPAQFFYRTSPISPIHFLTINHTVLSK